MRIWILDTNGGRKGGSGFWTDMDLDNETNSDHESVPDLEKEADLYLKADPEMEAYLIRIMKKFRIMKQTSDKPKIHFSLKKVTFIPFYKRYRYRYRKQYLAVIQQMRGFLHAAVLAATNRGSFCVSETAWMGS